MGIRGSRLSLMVMFTPLAGACGSSASGGDTPAATGGQGGSSGAGLGLSGGSVGVGGGGHQAGGSTSLASGGTPPGSSGGLAATEAGGAAVSTGGRVGTGTGGGSIGAGGSLNTGGSSPGGGGRLDATGGSAAPAQGGSTPGSGGTSVGAGASGTSTCVAGVQTGSVCDPLGDTTDCVRSTRLCVCSAASSTWTCTPTGGETGGAGSGGQAPGAGGGSAGEGENGVGGREDALGGGSGGDPSTGGSENGGASGGAPEGEILSVYETEDTGADCPAPEAPAFSELPEISYLPDPFLKVDGTSITRKADWRCRRAEIKAMIERWDVGEKPGKPSIFEASLQGNTISITVGEGSNSFTMTAAINRPAGAPTGPVPAIIGINTPTGSLPTAPFSSRGIATITYDSSQLAPSSFSGGGARTDGNFYKLYPGSTAGYMIRWAWGISRIIDALEALPEANIDVTHLAVSGCSFQGKIALYAGAFDERIALTIPHESGGGGTISWRYSDMLEDRDNTEVENLHHALGAPWYAEAVAQFADEPNKLPFDHHELIGMIAPRAVLAIESSQIARMGAEAARVDALAAREIWTALGVPYRMGATEENTAHCSWHEGFTPALEAYLDAFLLDEPGVDTDVLRSKFTAIDTDTWIPWETPELE